MRRNYSVTHQQLAAVIGRVTNLCKLDHSAAWYTASAVDLNRWC